MDEEKNFPNEAEPKTDDARNAGEAAENKADGPPKKDRWWILPLSAAALALFLNAFIFLNARIPSGSMEPTISVGSLVLGDRTAYLRGNPQVGDVVFFRHKSEFGSKILIKRVVAVSGQTFAMAEGRVYLDGQLLDEPYVMEFSGDYYPETVVPAGCCIVLGDHRNNSNDARFWSDPFIHREELLARAMFVYFPFSQFHTL